ncbi:MAG: twin-arginine translocase TatA/TatE family subunit [Jannaschia sp.]
MLNNIGLPGLLLIAVVVLVLFGRGKISSLMGEVGKGITAFKKGVTDGSRDDDPADATLADGTAARDVTPEADAHVASETATREKV